MTGPDPREVARLLRQRREMGLPPLVLGGGSREEFLEVARGAAERGAAMEGRAAVPPTEPPPSPAGPGAPEPGVPSEAVTAPPKAVTAPSEAVTAPAEGVTAPASPGVVHGDDATPDDGSPELDGMGYPGLREVALQCTRCGLSETRTQVVFADGSPQARLVVVGEAPGANEDRTGVPFVGQAGKLLDLMLASIDLSREASVYICNVLKCRPPGNRNPQPHEIRACSPFLRRQLELVQPQALLAVGTFAGQLLTSVDAPLGKLRGTVHSYQGIPLVVTYHPAALLRNSGWVRAAWDDLQLLRQVMD